MWISLRNPHTLLALHHSFSRYIILLGIRLWLKISKPEYREAADGDDDQVSRLSPVPIDLLYISTWQSTCGESHYHKTNPKNPFQVIPRPHQSSWSLVKHELWCGLHDRDRNHAVVTCVFCISSGGSITLMPLSRITSTDGFHLRFVYK